MPPSAPRSLAASPNLAAGVGLTWQAPATQGSSPVTGYRIYRATGGGALASLVTVDNVLDVHRRLGGQRHDVPLRRRRAERRRRGRPSGEVTAVRGTAPGAPGSLTATATKSGIALTWAAPTSNGGSAITGYRVYRGTAGGGDDVLRRGRPERHRHDRHHGGEADEVLLPGHRGQRARRGAFTAEVNATAK